MNRVIKFRCWNPNKKEMFHPSVIEGGTGNVFETGRDYEDYQNVNWPLMQFTGMLDKNGKEIYEGDIISVWMSAPWDDEVPVEYKGAVEFAEGQFCFGGIDSGEHNGALNEVIGGSALVIGNLYENPDLLK